MLLCAGLEAGGQEVDGHFYLQQRMLLEAPFSSAAAASAQENLNAEWQLRERSCGWLGAAQQSAAYAVITLTDSGALPMQAGCCRPTCTGMPAWRA
jgi:hypothetical protein